MRFFEMANVRVSYGVERCHGGWGECFAEISRINAFALYDISAHITHIWQSNCVLVFFSFYYRMNHNKKANNILNMVSVPSLPSSSSSSLVCIYCHCPFQAHKRNADESSIEPVQINVNHTRESIPIDVPFISAGCQLLFFHSLLSTLECAGAKEWMKPQSKR